MKCFWAFITWIDSNIMNSQMIFQIISGFKTITTITAQMFLYWCSRFTFNILHSDTANEEVCLKRRDMKDCIWSLTLCQYLKKHILHETSVRSSLKWDVRLGVGLSRNWLVPKMYSLDYCTDIFPYLIKLAQSDHEDVSIPESHR